MSRITRFTAALFLALTILLPSHPAAHDIPNDVTVQSFLKPEGQRLRFLVRVPLASMLDVDWPRQGPDTIDLNRAQPFLRDAATLWLADNVTMYEGNTALAYPRVAVVRGSAAADRSFDSYEQALAHVNTPAEQNGDEVMISAGFLDVLFEYDITSDTSRFSIDPRFERLGVRTVTLIRVLLPDGSIRGFEMVANPGLVRLDPEWYQASWRFIKLGFSHFLDGPDHLLFLFCLVLPFRRIRDLAVVVGAFSAAHSITLIASAYNVSPDALWFPPLIETLIAASILYFAVETMIGTTVHRRWMMAFAFGLVHGFGFSFALRQTVQFAGSHLLASLLSFNLGIELGQLAILILLVPSLALLFRYVVVQRTGIIVLSALATHTAWHWTTDRFDQLRQYRFQSPDLTPTLMVGVLRWLMIAVAVAGVFWLIGTLRSRRVPNSEF